MSTPAISVSDLFCLYSLPGGATVAAIRGMSLVVAPGERLVVHGPNGSGKTTLLRVLAGEVAPSAGSVRVANVELFAAPQNRRTTLRRNVLGLVDQHSGRSLRSEISVVDNVAMQLRLAGVSRAEARSSAMSSLDALGLAAFAERRPDTLSAGEAQRVAVCAATAHRPVVLLADEPTGELDIDAADAVYDRLAAAAALVDATLLLVTHDPRAARIADRVVRIRDGRLSEQWDPADPAAEELVVDDRGWLRLPEALRSRGGPIERVRVTEREGEVVLGDLHRGSVTQSARPSLPAPAATGRDLDSPLVQLRDLRVSYGSRVLFSGLDASIAPGVLTVVRGRSGAGKSTLLRMMVGLADPDSGTVELGGRALTGLDRPARAAARREMSAVTTQSGAFAETLDIYENLALARVARGLETDRDAAMNVIELLGLAALVTRQVRLLSGGERQRVGVARALVVQRPLIVLDEPTSSQDEAHAALLTEVLVAATAVGTGVVCATHDNVLADAAGALLELA